MSHTYAARLKAGLVRAGWKPDPMATTRKYDVFTHPDSRDTKLFVGPAGALRQGRCATQSWSIGDPASKDSPRCATYRKLLAVGDRVLSGELSPVKPEVPAPSLPENAGVAA